MLAIGEHQLTNPKMRHEEVGINGSICWEYLFGMTVFYKFDSVKVSQCLYYFNFLANSLSKSIYNF